MHHNLFVSVNGFTVFVTFLKITFQVNYVHILCVVLKIVLP